MQSNKGRDTEPELRLRRRLHAMGLRYFVNRRPIKPLRRTADIVFPRLKIAVFVDGCFWHSCDQHGTTPSLHSDFWAAKLKRNAERDKETDALLRAAGWHEDSDWAASTIARIVAQRRAATHRTTSDRVTPGTPH
jgi:DNA mismatch endonuclease (patch repair protein)